MLKLAFVLLLSAVAITTGCSIVNEVHPNLATRLVKDYPRLQAICDSVGGCENVKIECRRYDSTGNSDIRNETFWTVETDPLESGTGFSENDHLDTNRAINDAITNYWKSKLEHSETVYPHSTNCEKDCGK